MEVLRILVSINEMSGTSLTWSVAYTNAKFREVKDECAALMHANLTKLATIGGVSFYKVTEKVLVPVWKAKWKDFTVSTHDEKGEFTYSCKLFKFSGIMCRHIIKVIENEDIQVIPERYILSRWRKDSIRGYENIKVTYYDPGKLDKVKKQKELSQRHA
ncbi:Protein FAR1-RELATED SEQUENCE 2 [Bienertia sinuspersici]